jgi:hypothetical protein
MEDPETAETPKGCATLHEIEEFPAEKYGVPANEVVLGDIAVETENEIVGTVRGWRAAAQAARPRETVTAGPGDRESRLRGLEAISANMTADTFATRGNATVPIRCSDVGPPRMLCDQREPCTPDVCTPLRSGRAHSTGSGRGAAGPLPRGLQGIAVPHRQASRSFFRSPPP